MCGFGSFCSTANQPLQAPNFGYTSTDGTQSFIAANNTKCHRSSITAVPNNTVYIAVLQCTTKTTHPGFTQINRVIKSPKYLILRFESGFFVGSHPEGKCAHIDRIQFATHSNKVRYAFCCTDNESIY